MASFLFCGKEEEEEDSMVIQGKGMYPDPSAVQSSHIPCDTQCIKNHSNNSG
jgi:hypothetical protein